MCTTYFCAYELHEHGQIKLIWSKIPIDYDDYDYMQLANEQGYVSGLRWPGYLLSRSP